MPDFAAFFLNSDANVVQLETLEISHPYFSKKYFIVRNNTQGLTATLEDSSSQTFEYYPVKITPSGSYNDLDLQLQVSFGDLGEILPQELDRLLSDTQQAVYQGALLGAWCDGSGNLILPPFLIGQGGQFQVPDGATTLQMGICDSFMFDNSGNFAVVINGAAAVNVGSLARLYDYTVGVKNTAYPYSPTSSSAPIVVAVSVGELLQISVTGTVQISGTSSNLNGLGQPDDIPAGVPGSYIVRPSLPKTIIKPKLIYRTFRSDDLSAPLYGPVEFDVISIAFKKEGATLQCNAPRLNLTSTGELYTLDRFPMLYGFI